MRQDTYDVVIVGSGATGGWAAMQLTGAGLRVAVLEAGRALDPATDFTEHKRPFDMPFRGRRSSIRPRRPAASSRRRSAASRRADLAQGWSSATPRG